jgi:uncharacterized repeat protein (TIGR02543 family)
MKLISSLIARWTFCLLLLAAVVLPQAHALNDFVTIGSMATARYCHTATLLADGKLLVAGGFIFDGSGSNVTSAELYDPATGLWSTTGSMNNARYNHTATLLANGKVLVVGGYSGNSSLTSAELYDPSTGLWSMTGSLATGRYAHTATLLANGKVLVAGGKEGGSALSSTELYDPVAETWIRAGSMSCARSYYTATLLANGKVLVAGGEGISYAGLSSAELYDPATGLWSATSSMATVRSGHTATLLANGKVLVAGGYDGNSSLTSAQLYDSTTGLWNMAGSLVNARNSHTATLLTNGKVLVAGGRIGIDNLSSTELFDPATGLWSSTGSLATARRVHVATLLANGKVLVTGGFGNNGYLSSAELYQNQPSVPSIATAPSSTTANQGGSATFSVMALGSPRLDYQWKKNGMDLVGATAATLMLNNVQPSDLGNYTVVVSNGLGSVTSDAATLTVIMPPTITAQPVGVNLYLGNAITLSVTATGSGPLSYQWKKDGVDVAGANGTSLDLNPVLASNAGTYTVVISNVAGSVTSSAAVVIATADLRDSDGDGLSNYEEVFVYHTDPNKADTDGDGLTDGYEVGVGRFSIVAGSFTWAQAQANAHVRGGELACFPTQTVWKQAIASLGATALDDYMGLWIGASDAATEGTWKWVNGTAFTFNTWALNRPSSVANNTLDYAEVSGGAGADIGMWYDRSPTTVRDGYILEIGYTTDPLVADADGDGLNDSQEKTAGTNPFVADTDGDGLTDGEEVNLTHTNPLKADSNNNGINDAADDQDGDGLTNLAEIRTYHTNPLIADTDGDGLTDGAEVLTHHSNPLAADTDGDGFNDGYEVANASSPTSAASFPTYTLTLSGSGAVEGGSFGKSGTLAHGSTATLTAVASAGYVFSGWTGDLVGTTNPKTLLMNGNKTVGATFANDTGDNDSDGLTNYEESVVYGTNPALVDTDGDGLSDRDEIQTYHSNPLLADSNSDGLADGVAVQMGFDPLADHAALVQIIQNSRATFGLYTKQDMTDLRPGSTTVKVLPSAGGVQLRLKVQQSTDLKSWQDAGEAVFEQATDPAAPKKFFRFGVN